jgi:hypothetical protein
MFREEMYLQTFLTNHQPWLFSNLFIEAADLPSIVFVLCKEENSLIYLGYDSKLYNSKFWEYSIKCESIRENWIPLYCSHHCVKNVAQ